MELRFSNHQARAFAGVSLECLSRAIQDAVDSEANAHFASKQQELVNATMAFNTSAMYRILRPLYKTQPRSCISVTNDDGAITVTQSQSKAAFAQHFGRQLMADQSSFADLIKDDRHYTLNRNLCLKIQSCDMDPIDTLGDTAHVCSAVRPYIAVGEDLLGSELLAAAPLQCARLRHPLTLKTTLAIQQPLQWKVLHVRALER